MCTEVFAIPNLTEKRQGLPKSLCMKFSVGLECQLKFTAIKERISNGMVERFNQTLLRYLAKVIEDKQNDWDKHIQPFLLSYRSAVQETSTVTPAFANFGRELRLLADLIT
ncbi:putative integrase core domain protein [Danaus plexippus plexippus]|uniref:Integrase core domain protein n=1 Tax=Danaus plexippus plexippus TaxID=278856 RepID=A0A212FH30_DANPL|nr:putative integrase core domain protein [Danaus plexippus plexippus]